MKPWGKQRVLKGDDSPVPDIHYIIETAETIKDNRLRALYCLLYLTGGRICELVRKKGYDLVAHSDNKITKDFKYNKVSNDEKDKPSVRKRQLRFEELNSRQALFIDLRNEKNKEKHTKTIPIPLDRPEYAPLITMIKEYISSLEMDQELFPFNYQYAYRLLKPYYNPHWFRHIRATHLTLNNDLPGPLLRKYMGWTDDRPAAKYQELKVGDILDKL
jgi:integrase